MREFRGNVAVVTGAASGMGRAFAERFAREGMHVVLADIEEPALDLAVSEMSAAGYDVIGVRTDVARLQSVQDLARRALERFGKIHVLCNNAGVDGYLDGPIWEATDKDWQWTFGVNFWGVVHGVRTFLPIMLEQDEDGHMVNTASATGVVQANNMYGVTKHAVVALSEVVYTQLKQRGARVGISALCPGVVNTRIFEAARNRPAELRNAEPGSGASAGAQMRAQMIERMASALPPAQVAEMLLDAIRNEQFYVMTDHEWDERIETRHRNIMRRGVPTGSPSTAQRG
jgi:NAD(P)-dependent dehydrogenase (short-subunit alcohol dehydrogenase family)